LRAANYVVPHAHYKSNKTKEKSLVATNTKYFAIIVNNPIAGSQAQFIKNPLVTNKYYYFLGQLSFHMCT